MCNGSAWLRRFDQLVVAQIDNVSLNNEQLASQVHMSERHLFRRIKELTGMPPQKYIRKKKLAHAKHYLENGFFLTVKETAYAVGYINISYFIQQFEKEFGRKPLSILREAGWR
jgi:AraC-like DNA-binding protein